MYFIAKKDELLKALNSIIGIVTKKSAIAHLSHVKIVALKDELIFTATDNEISITQKLKDTNVKNKGELTLDASLLYSIIKKLPSNKEIEFKALENDNIQINCANVQFSLPFLNVEYFPIISEENIQFSINLIKNDIKLLLEKIKFAICTESSRVSMCGIFIKAGKGFLISAATDGHRLATAKVKNKNEDEFSFILPKKAVNEVTRTFIGHSDINVSIHGEEGITRVKFYTEDISLITKLVAATFPDFENAIPEKFEYFISINKKEFIESLERVGLVSSEQSRSVKIEFANNQINISATNSTSSFAKEIIELEHNIENLTIYFNYSYLIETLSSIESEDALIHMNTSKSPVIIKDEKIPELTYIVMPMSVND